MTTTIQRLDQTATTLNAVVQVCSNATSKPELITALSSAYRSLCSDISFLKEHEKRKYIQARTALIAVSNIVDGVVQGLTNNEMSKGAVRKVANTLSNKFIPKFAEGLLAQAEAEQNSESAPKKEEKVPTVVRDRIKINISGSAEMREAYKVVAESSSSVGAEVTSKGPISELEAMSKQARALLPVKIPGDFKIVRAPIVPVFSNLNAYKPENLMRAGFKAIAIEGFVILKDQILLLVSRTRALDSHGTPLALAYSVVDMLNDRGTQKYEIVSDVANANPRNADLLMFWIMPSNRMSSMMKLLGGKGANNLKWGLPLASSTAEIDAELVKKREVDGQKNDIINVPKAAKLFTLTATKKVAGILKEMQVRPGAQVQAFLDSVKRRIGISSDGTTVAMWIPIDGQGLRVFIHFAGFSDFIKANRVTHRSALAAFNLNDEDMREQEATNKASLKSTAKPAKEARVEEEAAKIVQRNARTTPKPAAKPVAKPAAQVRPASQEKLRVLVDKHKKH